MYMYMACYLNFKLENSQDMNKTALGFNAVCFGKYAQIFRRNLWHVSSRLLRVICRETVVLAVTTVGNQNHTQQGCAL
jgi:hypothetical protein